MRDQADFTEVFAARQVRGDGFRALGCLPAAQRALEDMHQQESVEPAQVGIGQVLLLLLELLPLFEQFARGSAKWLRGDRFLSAFRINELAILDDVVKGVKKL